MNIGVVTSWFERGAAYVSRQYCQALRSAHNVFVYARGGERYAKGDPAWDHDSVTWAKRLPHPLPTVIDRADFIRWIHRNHIDLVFFNEQHWWPPVLWCKKLGVRTGAYVDYYTERTIPLFAAYDFLVCNTRRHFSAFQWHPRAVYIPWGTDVRLYRPQGLAAVEFGSVTFFHSAGVSPERKGSDLVLEAFAQVSGRAKLVIHSQRELNAVFPRLAPLISDLQKRRVLRVITATVPAPGLYHLGDVYVYPSRLEGIGLTIPEALASGLPVITTDCPPMNEFVTPTSGMLVKVDRLQQRADGYYWPRSTVRITSLVECMQSYVDNAVKIHCFKAAARSHAEESLDWPQRQQRIIEVFEAAYSHPASTFSSVDAAIRQYERARRTWRGAFAESVPTVARFLYPCFRIMKSVRRRTAGK